VHSSTMLSLKDEEEEEEEEGLASSSGYTATDI
jgi:hypothetical protein